MAQYDGSIRINTQINSKDASAQLVILEKRMITTADKVDVLRSKMKSLKNAKFADTTKTSAFGAGIKKYLSLRQLLEYIEKKYSILIQRRNEFMRRHNIQAGGYERLQAVMAKLQGAFARIIRPIGAMKTSFVSAANNMRASAYGIAVSITNGVVRSFRAMRSIATLSVSNISGALSKMADVIKKIKAIISAIASAFRKVFSVIMGFGKSIKHVCAMIKSSFENLLKFAIKIFSVLMRMVKDAVIEGLGNLRQYSKPVDDALSSLKSSLLQLKNSLATAFAPILTTIAPALTALINMVSRAVTAVGMLIAALTGQKSFVKATNVQQGYAESLGGTADAAKKANKQLSSLDKLNNLTSDDTGGSGGGGGGAGAGDMFETVDIPSKIADLAKMIKESWEKADFTEIGVLIGKKLKDALDNIPWTEIQSTAAKVGKSLATLIGGFVSVEGLGYSIGNTIAQAINTGLLGLNEFAKWLPWDRVGKFLGEGVNGVLQNIDWVTALSAAKNLGKGIAKAINSFFKETDFNTVGKSVANFVNTAIIFALSSGKELKFGRIGKKIADGINGFFRNLKVKELADAISTWVKGALKMVSTFLKKTDFQMIGEKIGEFLANLDLKGTMKELGKVLWEAVKGAFRLLKGLFKSAPLEASLLTAFALLKFSGLGKAVAGNIATAIKGSIGNSLANSGLQSVLMSKLGTIVGSAMIVFGQFSIVSQVFSNLTNGSENLAIGLGKVTGAAGVALGALKLIGLSTPFGALIIAAGTLAGAIWGVWKESSNLDKQFAEQEEIKKYGQTIESLTEEIEAAKTETQEWIKQAEQAVESAGIGDSQYLQNLSDRYFELSEKEHKTNEEMEEMKRIAGLLVKKMPELEEHYNKQTGLIDATKNSVDALIQSRLQEARTQAIEEQLVEGYKKQADKLKEVEKASKPAIDAENKMKDLHSELKKELNRREKWQAYIDLGEQIQNATGDTTELSLKQQKIMEDLKKDHGQYVDAATIEEDVRSAQEAIELYQGEYDGIVQSFEDSKSTYEGISKTVSELETEITKGMTDAAKGGVDGYTNWINSRTAQKKVEDASIELGVASVGAFKSKKSLDENSPSKKFEQSGKYAVDGYIQGISKNKQSAIDSMNSFAGEIVDTFKDIKEKFIQKGEKIISGIEEGIKNLWTDFTQEWKKKKNAVVDTFKNIKSDFQEKGEKIISGIEKGITDNWKDFLDFLGQKKDKVVNKFNDIKGKFSEKGEDIISGIKKGITDNWKEFLNFWSGKKGDIENTFSGIKGSMEGVGKNIVNGIIDGIRSLWSTLVSWANDIKNLFNIKPIASRGAGVSMVGGNSPRMASYEPETASMASVPIPKLATGVVIPPNREFLAVLGDQKHGTNIEAPLSTIEQAVENALKRNGGSDGIQEVTIKVPVEIDGRVLFELMRKFDTEQFRRTGRPSFQI